MRLQRQLGLGDAIILGLGSMLGAGVFVVWVPAAQVAGAGLLLGLALAAVVAYCNATSTARLAARHPASGGIYLYGRERLGPVWGHLAGWSFVVGKTASCAAMARAAGEYLWPGRPALAAAGCAAAATVLVCVGVRRSALLTRVIVAVVLAVLAAVALAAAFSGRVQAASLHPREGFDPAGVLQAAALLFFAFAGYARIATLGEEVRDPARTIPRAIGAALALVLGVYLVVGVVLLGLLGGQLGGSEAPIADSARAAGAAFLVPAVTVAAASAAAGALLALLLGVSRTVLAMARDRHLPRRLAAIGSRGGVPVVAGAVIGTVVTLLAATLDLRAAIGFSSFTVLTYYAVGHLAAWQLTAGEGRPPRAVPVVGLAGCLLLAFAAPLVSVLAGLLVLALGLGSYALTRGG